MSSQSDRTSPNDNDAPRAEPVDPGVLSQLGFMADQIAVMRCENPDVWARIDAMAAGRFDPREFTDIFRFERNECVNCRYDLYGNTSGRCPECGTPLHATPDLRRSISIRILDAQRRADPRRWREICERLEKERLERVQKENAVEGARRDEIRKKALQSWLDRKQHGRDRDETG